MLVLSSIKHQYAILEHLRLDREGFYLFNCNVVHLGYRIRSLLGFQL